MAPENYASPGLRFRGHEYVIFYSTTPWVQYLYRGGWISDHAKWELDMARKYGPDSKWPRWRDLHPWAPWRPIRQPQGLAVIFIPWWAQLAGWLIALWAAWEALRA